MPSTDAPSTLRDWVELRVEFVRQFESLRDAAVAGGDHEAADFLGRSVAALRARTTIPLRSEAIQCRDPELAWEIRLTAKDLHEGDPFCGESIDLSRRGELQGLRWEDVDLAAGVIRVERGWDAAEGEIAPKSSAGRRKVPITGILRDYLLAHKLATDGEGLVFSNRFPDRPFSSVASQKRADKAWKAAGLGRLTLHECRHGYASFMIDAGINAKAERARAADSGETGAFTGASVAQAPEKALD